MNDQAIKDFFSAYERRVNDALIDPLKIDSLGMTSAYTSNFIEASPSGVQVFQNNEQFVTALGPAFEGKRRIGTRSMSVTALNTTIIDDLHAAVKIRWLAHYERRKDQKAINVEFDETYLLQSVDGKPRIFAYVAGDEQETLKKYGLLD